MSYTVFGSFNISNASMARPDDTTAYAANDVVGTSPATNLEFKSIGSKGSKIMIVGATIKINVNAVPSGMSSFRLHLYNESPTAIADNAAYNLATADAKKYLGYVDISTPQDLGDNLWGEDVQLNKTVKMSSNNLYGILETKGGYTPSALSETTIEIHAMEV
jgi:hypothetical protein